MKKLLIFALCATIPMVGFAQKKAKKGKNVEAEVVAPVVEVLDDEECLMLLSLSHESVKAEQYDDAYENWSKLYQSRPDFNKTIFTDGNKILEYKWNQAQTPEEKAAEPLQKRLNNAGRFGYPALVVLSPDGKVLHIQDSSFLEHESSYDAKKVLRFLKSWTPEASKM